MLAAHASTPVITNNFPSSAVVGQTYTHMPIVDDPDTNYVTVSNYQAQTSSGILAGEQYRVNTHSPSHQHKPAFVQLNDGVYVIAWQSMGQDGSGDGLYGQRYSQDGQVIGLEFQLNSIVVGDQESVALARDTNGGFIAVWESENIDDSGRAIVVRRFNADGTAINNEIVVNSTIAGDQTSPDIAALSDGSYVVAWQSAYDDGSGTNIVARVLQNDGFPVGTEWMVNDFRPENQERPKIAAMSDDSLVILWQSGGQDSSGYGVYHRRFLSNGSPIDSSDVLVNLAQQYMSQHLAEVAVLSNDNYVVTYTSTYQGDDTDGDGVFQSVYDSAGNAVVSDVLVNTYIDGAQEASHVAALTDSGYIVVWNSYPQDGSGYGVYFQQYDNGGLAVGDETLAAELTEGDQRYPLIGSLYDGGFVIVFRSEWTAWDEYWGVHARNFSVPQNMPGTPGGIQHTDLSWLQRYHVENSQQIFQYRQLDSDSWTNAIAELLDGRYVVSLQGLDNGDYEYRIDYVENGILVHQLTNSFFVGGMSNIAADELYFSLDSNISPIGLTMDTATGAVNWTPTQDQLGGMQVGFTVYNNEQLEATQIATITVEDNSVEAGIYSEPVTHAIVGEQYTYPVISHPINPGAIRIWHIETGIEGMTISPPGQTTDVNATINWVPSANDVGEHLVTILLEENDQIVAQQDFLLTVVEGNQNALSITSTPDLNALSQNNYTYQIVTNYDDVLYYSLTEGPDGMAVGEQSGMLSWVPGLNDIGDHTVTVAATEDPLMPGATQTFILRVYVANNPPRFISHPVEQGVVGEQYYYAAIAADEETQSLTYRLSEAPEGMSIELSTGFISWLPNDNYIGLQAVSVVVTDEGGLSAQQDYQIFVDQANTAPSIISEPVTHASRGNQYTYDVDAIDPDFLDTITFILLESPQGMTINESTGEIHWDTSNAALDRHPVSVFVYDSSEASDQQNFLVSVSDNNLPPLIISGAITQANEAQLYQYDVNAEDPNDADALIYNIHRGPEGMGIDANSGVISWVEEGEYYVGVGQPAESCRMPVPDIGSFEPVLKWEWNSSGVESTYVQVMAPPAVAQLSDDNGDGLINNDDTPDVIFASFVSGVRSEAVLRVISGADGSEILTINNPEHRVAQFSVPAIGDIDGDGRPEIVALGFDNKMFVFEDDGSLKWELQDSRLSLWSPNNYGGPSLADLDQDGIPEIIFGTAVISAEGEILWKGTGTHYGRNHWDANVADYFTYAVDWDNAIEGLEVIAGASVYDKDGNLLWQNDSVGDGFTAVANFDLDDSPELVVVNDGRVYIVDNDGQTMYVSEPLPGGGVGGPPTVADMDGDGLPEIGVAGRGAYSVFNSDASLLWSSTTQDYSSHFTGSTVFDFDGDGRAEVVYADEIFLHVYRGDSGEVLFRIPNGSGTALEYPVVADIDNDNHAELLVVRNYFQSSVPGIRAFEDAHDSWVSTRSVWNEYSYHINNINDDGSVPVGQEKSWQTHNSFRLNAFGDRSPLAQADLIINEITVLADELGSGLAQEFDAQITVHNSGEIEAKGLITVSLFTDDPNAGGMLLGETVLSEVAAGASVQAIIRSIAVDPLETSLYAVISVEGINECVTENNAARAAFVHVNVADPSSATDHQVYALNVLPDVTSPVFTSDNSVNPIAGELFSYDLEATGSGDLTYILMTGPEGMSVDSASGILQWSPGMDAEDKRFNIEVRVEGEQGLFDIQNLTLEVQAARVNAAPVITKEVACAFDQLNWLEVSGSFVVSNESRTFNESTSQSGNAIADLDLGLTNTAYWEIQVDAIDLLQSLGWGIIRDTETVLQPANNLTWDHRSTIVARTTYSWVIDYGGGGSLYNGTSEEAAFNVGDILMVAWDQGRLYFGSNGVWWNNADPAAGTGFIAEGLSGFRPYLSHNNINGNSQYTINSTNSDFVYEPPFLCPAADLFSVVGDDYLFDADAVDLDGDALVYALTESPSGMTIDADSGLVQWTPSVLDVGTHTVNVTVSDGRGGEDNYAYTVSIEGYVNAPPVIISYPQTRIRNPEYFYLVRVDDPNFGDVHTFYLDTAPSGMTIDLNSGVILWEPTDFQIGDHDIDIRVRDSGGLEAIQSYTLSYVIDPTAPSIISDPVVVAEEAVLYQYDVDAIDPNQYEVLTYSLNQSPVNMSINQDSGMITWYAYSPEGFTEISFDELEEAAHINHQYPGIHFSAYDTDGTPKPIYAEFHDDSRYGASENMYLAPREYRTDNIYTWEINFDSLADYFYIRVLDAEEALTIETYRGNVQVGSYPQPRSGNEGHDFSVGEIGGTLLFDRIVFHVDPGGPELFDNVKYHTSALATVEVRATNTLGKFDEQRFDINFTTGNFPPVFTSRPIRGGVANSEYRYRLAAIDHNSDPIDFELMNAPAGMQVGVDGYITWSPAFADVGSYVVRIMARDGQGGESAQEYLLTIRDTDSPAIFTTDPLLEAYPNIEYTYKARAYDPEGDEVHFYLESGPAGMSVNLTDGQVVWTPSDSDVGDHDISIEARGRFGGQSAFQNYVLRVNGDNQPPRIISSAITSVYVGSEYSYTVNALDTDETLLLNYQLVTSPPLMSITELTGVITWSPVSTDVGEHLVQVQVIDSDGLIDSQEFTLTVLEGNAAPIITSAPPSHATINTTYIYNIIGSDENASDVLSYTLESGPIEMDVDGATGTLSWEPGDTDVGPHDVSVRATDSIGAYAQQNFVLTVQSNDSEPPVVGLVVNPVNPVVGAPVTIQVNAFDNIAVASLTLEINGQTIVLDNSNSATYVPSISGIHTVTATAVDTSGNSTSQTLDISASVNTNSAPAVTSTPIEVATIGAPYFYQVTATDAENDPIEYALLNHPLGMYIDHSTGEIIWTPSEIQLGTYDLVVRISDGNLFVDQSWTITVSEPVVAPLNADIFATPKFVDAGEVVVVSVTIQNPVGEVSTEITVNNVVEQLNQNNELHFTPMDVGAHDIVVEVSDTVDLIVLAETVYVRDPNDVMPPIAEITSPEDDLEITQPIAVIGTASDANLAEYRLLISERNAGLFTEIGSGSSSVTNGELGTIDPMMLLNGIYDLVLEVTDINGVSTTDSVVFVVDGDMKLGEFTFTVDDINIPVAGIPVRVSRTYDTRRRGEALSFGQGWSVDYQNVRIMESRKLGHYWEVVEKTYQYILNTYCIEPIGDRAPYVFVETPDGELHKFDVVASIGGGDNCQDIDPNLVNVSFQFEAREGTFSSLQSNDYGLMRMNGDDLSNFDENWGVVADPSTYTLTTEEGYIYNLDQGFGVRSITDPYGNQLTYGTDGVSHSSGKGISITRDTAGRIQLITGPKGNTVEYTYDSIGNLIEVTDQTGDRTKYTYYDEHYLNEIIDASGVAVASAQYENSGRLSAVSDADGGTIQYVYTLAQNQHQVVDRMGNSWLYTYDEFGRIVSMEDPNGDETSYGYDNFGNEISVSKGGMVLTRNFDSRGRVIDEFVNGQLKARLTYDDRGNILTQEDGLGRITTTTYDSGNQPLVIDFPGGRQLQNEYSSSGVLNRVVMPDGSVTTLHINGNDMVERVIGPDGTVTDYAYDENNNQSSESRVRTVNGASTTEVITHTFSAKNRKTGSTFADGTSIGMTYDYQGLTSMSGRYGRAISNVRDTRGYLTEVHTDTGHTIEMAYDKSGNLVSQSDRYGNVQTFEYDAHDRQVRTVESGGSTQEVIYNLSGQKVSEKDANDNWITFTYYPSGNLHKVIGPVSEEVSYEYDLADRLVSVTDQKGRRTEFIYDESDNLTRTNYADGSFVLVEYDMNGRRVKEWNEESQQTSYSYDAYNRLTEVVDAAGGTTQYSYDELGNMISMTDARGAITKWDYNSNRSIVARELPLGEKEYFTYGLEGEVVSRTDFNGNLTQNSYDQYGRLSEVQFHDGEIVTYAYASNGEWQQVTDSNGSTTYFYDENRRVSSVENSQGETISYIYDGNGNTLSVTTPNGVHQYHYDARNLMYEAIDPALNITSYEYDETGMVTKVTYPNGLVAEYIYDLRDRPTRLSYLDALSNPIDVLDYTYDLSGNILTISSLTGRQYAYSYDELQRLVSESVVDPQFGDYFYTYSYDENGNRLQRVGNLEVTNYSYDDNNRLISVGPTTYSYDDEGNLLTKFDTSNTWNYSYDSRNRLVSADVPGNNLSFSYDHNGNRTGRSLNGVSTRYLWDLNQENAQLMASYDGNGVLESQHHYGIGRISENDRYFLNDYKGSTIGLADSVGNVTDSFTYDAFGNSKGHDGSSTTEFTFNGEQVDQELGMQYLRARYYDTEVGRFTQMDTWSGHRHSPLTLNKYIYGDANPVMGIDPSGHFTLGSLGAAQKIIGKLSTYAIRTGGKIAVACAKTMARFYAKAGAGITQGSKKKFLRKIRGGGDCAAVAWATGFGIAYSSGLQMLEPVAKAAPSWGCYNKGAVCFRSEVNKSLFKVNRNPFNMDWHHLVEKNQTQFGAHAINSVANLVPTPRTPHRSHITPYFKRHKFTNGGGELRNWLKKQKKGYGYQWRLGVVVWYKAVSGQWDALKNTSPRRLMLE